MVTRSVSPDTESDELDDQFDDVDDEGTEQPDYETRFKGLQASYQQEVEGLKNQLFTTQAQSFAQSLRSLPPQEAERQWNAFIVQQQQEQGKSQVIQAMMVMNEKMKEEEARSLARKYKVPMKELLRFNDPDAMEAAAKLASGSRKTGDRDERQRSGRDNFGSGGTGSAPPNRKKPTNVEEARKNVKDELRRRLTG